LQLLLGILLQTKLNAMKKLLFLAQILLFCQVVFSQQLTLSKQLKDDKNDPVSFAAVSIKNTNRQAVADADGRFEIKANTGEIMLITAVGFKPYEVTITGQELPDIVMERSILELGNVSVVGSRSFKRSATETAAPVDVIPVARVINQLGQVDVNQLLQFVAPSFNSNKQSGADGADHVDPATLRGLGPDQTLVLVNGKRRHQSALVNLYGSRGRGNTGTDLNTIPAAAIERIEILRDGASAQYGSDAIAGVINIVLKSNTQQLTANVMAGEYITGYGASLKSAKGKVLNSIHDGEQVNANLNYGWKLLANGFINVTGDVYLKEKTQRPNYTPLYNDSYRNKFGDLSSSNSSLYFNGALPLNSQAQVYAFGGINYRFGDAYAWSREAESERNVKSIYPNGFDPRIQSKILDLSFSMGLKYKFGEWNADFNATAGSNRFHYYADKTLNASMEAASPTKFDAGGFKLSQYVASANFSKAFNSVAKGLNLALGAEFRHEQYNIFEGELNSYKAYGPIIFSIINGDTTYRPGGSQGFPGFQPSDKVNRGRNNVGLYADAELDITKNFLLTGAVRLEDYSDFGFTHNYKISTRFKLFGNTFWRSSISTGFRAPSLPQINFSSTFTDVVAGKVTDKIIAPNYSNIARRVGIPELKQERSVNISSGITARAGAFNLTIDGYWVNIKDRIVLTGAFDNADDKIGNILKSLNIGAAQFFTNAVDTRTKGLDVVAIYSHRLGKGKLNMTLAANLNHMEIRDIKTSALLAGKQDIYFGKREQAFLLASAPPHKINLTLEYDINKFNWLVRFNRFASVTLTNWNDDPDFFQNKVTTDISIGYRLSKAINITTGGANILDVYPTHHDPGLTESGGMWDAVQMGFGGAFYFARVGFKL
jgi:iron complex outermembrane recepter protein